MNAILNVISRRAVEVKVTRPGSVSTLDGYRSTSAATEFETEVTIQPMTAKDLRNVPEGQNALQWFTVWGPDELRVKDQIHFNDVIYTVQRAKERIEGGFFRVQAVLVDNPI